MSGIRLGVLAVQGDVAENVSSLEASAAELGMGEATAVSAVKGPKDIAGLDGLVIPGGESTTIGRMSQDNGLLERIRQMASSGMPVLGICAGMVLLASRASDRTSGRTEQPLLGLLDVDLERNSFGRQRRSFEADVQLDPIGIPRCRGVFIRAPAILPAATTTTTTGGGPGGVEVLARLDERIVAVRRENVIGISFHPELAGDLGVHRYFIGLAEEYRRRRQQQERQPPPPQ